MVALFAATVLLAGDTDSAPFTGVRYVHRHVTEPRQIAFVEAVREYGHP